ncbi:MAG: acyl-CoA thioesterase [Clostridiales bacterium]|nr:acyl-CoA thioesterase [Clostridiales bacterium]
MEYTYNHKVQYYETDQMQIVHHSNYIRWFEEGRTEALEQLGLSYAKMEQMGIMSPVLSVEAQYKTMTHFGDVVIIKCEVAKYNGIRMEIKYTICDKETEEIRCSGVTSHCFLNKEGKIISLKKDYPEVHQKIKLMLEK